MLTKAIEKLQEESKNVSGKKESAVSSYVLDVLTKFCEQEPEFAQAVVETDKTFDSCLSKILKDSGDSISDLKVCEKAAQFYFPGSKVNFQMTIDLIGDANKKAGIILDLADFV